MNEDAERPLSGRRGQRPPRTAANAVVQVLEARAVDHVFFVPGESFLAMLEELDDSSSVRSITCRHEATAGHMAEAYGKLTGVPGVALVSRGPGATHASIACHTASQDATPMVLVIGDVSTTQCHREAFQKIDYRAMFGALAKRVMDVNRPEHLAEVIDAALTLASAGRPGPVVVPVPEDVFSAPLGSAASAFPSSGAEVDADIDLAVLVDRIGHARRPLIIAGGGGWTQDTSDALVGFASAASLPIASAFRCQDVVDNEAPVYVGHLGLGTNPRLWEYAAGADMVLNIGARFDAPTTRDFGAFGQRTDSHVVAHVYPDPAIFAEWPHPEIRVACTPSMAVRALAVSGLQRAPGWAEQVASLRAAYLQWRVPEPREADVNLGEIVTSLRQFLGDDFVITTGAGNYTGWVHRYSVFRRVGSYLGPRNGAMGYGVPAAIAAKLVRPNANVVAFAGDGCFLMASHELATIAKYGLKITMIVVNNGSFGTIRMHQDRRSPGRAPGTGLHNPDFVALARSYGLEAYLVTRTNDFYKTIEKALASESATVIEIQTPLYPISAVV